MKSKTTHMILSVLMVGSLLLGNNPRTSVVPELSPATAAAAVPFSAVDETKVPHYFGPNTNWALSPLTLPDVIVTIDPPAVAGGRQAVAQAVIGVNGSVTEITITDPGSGYTSAAPPSVLINNAAGTNVSALAAAQVTDSGGVTAINVSDSGAGYTAPSVLISGGGATIDATATASGGVDVVTLTNPGEGYSMPLVDFDFPGDPNGTIAKAHVVCVEVDCIPVAPATSVTIASIVVDDPGSGYTVAPNVVIRDGPIYAPLNNRLLNAALEARAEVMRTKPSGPLSPAGADILAPAATIDATATATLKILAVTVDTFGADYTSAPTVTITDPSASYTPATASAVVDSGGVTGITLLDPGTGYITPGGIKKFTDPLPDFCTPPDCPAVGKYIPLGVPEYIKYPLGDENGIEADQYEIGLVQYRTSFSSSLKDPTTGLPVGTLARGYVQLETAANGASGSNISLHAALSNELLDGTKVYIGCENEPDPTVPGCATQVYGVTPPQWLGPIVSATKNKPVRIIFRNLLPTGSDGNLFIPVDTTLMGAGMGPTGMWVPSEDGSVLDEARNPLCTQVDPITGLKIDMCYKDNRAIIHYHGGITPWISDGTPNQWITPADETTPWPQGVSVGNVPDMAAAGCDAADDGCATFYYTNQQSARLQWVHDHSYGITRLNVNVGEANGYLLTDDTEKALTADPDGAGPLVSTIPGLEDTKVLVIQDRTFVPQDSQMYNQYDVDGNVTSYGQDPTWDASRWGGYGSFWYHHVYMPAQNPGDPGGMSAYGRWMYGPWFWPPAAATVFGPIPNPYYNKDPKTGFTTDLATPCNLDDPDTWQYQVDPFCEPLQIPGTPNISVGMEQFNDTPIVNGVAYPTVTLDPKTYRLRFLNAANDRFFNLQWYVADPSTLADPLDPTSGTEVALNEAELAAAQTDINISPNPDTSSDGGTDPSYSLDGPDWIQIGNEGGFLPAPVVVDGQQYTTWITDPTRFDVGLVDLHSLLLAPAERADVIVDFSEFAGQTLILYNDGAAAYPARIPSYDYYTGTPDLSPNGAAVILPGYGPNTRTVMQVKIADGTPAEPYDLTKLQNAFSHKADGSGVFESGQHPIIVGQAAYNSAYGTSFSAGSNCNAPGSTLEICDGLVRVSDTETFGFNTLHEPTTKMSLNLEPKAIHDEMNATTFDEYGRMQATLGLEAQPPTPGLQNVTLYPYVNPVTELVDATNLPKNSVVFDSVTGLPVSDIKITAISTEDDGTQIWRITHNGVDTHPIHFHLFDVQPLNRVTWDNIVKPVDPAELGWKETVRVSPLEDTIVALRPIIPELPFELPNAIRNLNPAMPTGATAGFNNIDAQGNPTATIVNQLVNFGWEYVFHCHILSHEEMDMMRPVAIAMPPNAPDGLTAHMYVVSGIWGYVYLSWNDNSISETSYAIERLMGGVWTEIGTVISPLDEVNTKGVRSYIDKINIDVRQSYEYRVIALNKVGGVISGGFPSITAKSDYTASTTTVLSPTPPTNLWASLQSGPVVRLGWSDNANDETGFVIERSVNGDAFSILVNLPANTRTYTDAAVTLGNTYAYRVAATGAVQSPYSNTVTTLIGIPAAPTNLQAFPVRINNNNQRVSLTWVDNAINENTFLIQWSADVSFNTVSGSLSAGANATTAITGNIARQVWYFRIRATNGIGSSNWTTIGGIQPAAIAVGDTPLSPLVFLSSFDFGLSDWTDEFGELQVNTDAAMGDNGSFGLEASWDEADPDVSYQSAYVTHQIGEELGSYMVNFFFDPNSTVVASPVDIFTGLDTTGGKIFGVQFQSLADNPDLYQVRGWAKTEISDIFTDWVTVSDAAQNIQLDWQSDADSILNLYIQEELVASVGGDTSLYKLAAERLGPSTGIGEDEDLSTLSAPGMTTTTQTVYLDEFISLSTEITQPYTPLVATLIHFPFIMR